MSIRPLALPKDLVPAAEAIGKTFKYPGHPEWELDTAEQKQFADAIRRIRRIWPAVRLLQGVAPSMRDLLRGFVWEENGVLAGFVVAQRDGQTAVWQVEPLGVLPKFRRRGIARQLMAEAIRMVRSRGAQGIRLGVIDGNAPAQALYRSMGFVEYGGTILYTLPPTDRIEQPALPRGYEESPLARFDWRTRYEMDEQITPSHVKEFEAISPGRYRTPLLMRVISPFFRNSRDNDILIRRTSDHVAVARGGWSLSKSRGGTNAIRVRLDPAHTDLASYLVQRTFTAVLVKDPELQVELFLPAWMPDVARAAEALGFERRRVHKSMGMKL